MRAQVRLLLCVVLATAVVISAARHPTREVEGAPKVVIPGLLELDEELADAEKINQVGLTNPGLPSLAKLTAADDNVINDPDSRPVRATIYTYEEKQELKKNPGKKTVDIVKSLAKLKQRAKSDGTVDDIKRSWRLLEMYRVLKKEMLNALKATGQPVPDLPSQEKLSYDASGQPWGDAKMGQDELAAALQQRDQDIQYERSLMHYRALAESPKMREQAVKAKLAERAKRLAKIRKLNSGVRRVKGRPDFCKAPGCVVMDCMPPQCNNRPAQPVLIVQPTTSCGCNVCPCPAVAVVTQCGCSVCPCPPPIPAGALRAPTGFAVAASGTPQGLDPWLKPVLPGQALRVELAGATNGAPIPCACLNQPSCACAPKPVCACINQPSCPCAPKPVCLCINQPACPCNPPPKVVPKLPRETQLVKADTGKPATVDLQDIYRKLSSELSRSRFREQLPSAPKSQSTGSTDCKPPLCYTG